MRGILILIVVVLLMLLGGWIVFDLGDNSAKIEVRPDKIKQDTDQVIDKTKQLLREAGKPEQVPEPLQ